MFESPKFSGGRGFSEIKDQKNTLFEQMCFESYYAFLYAFVFSEK